MPPSISGAPALIVGSRYQAQESIRHDAMSRLWDKVTRGSRQQVAIHLPASAGAPARHIATGVPRSDFRRLMRVQDASQAGRSAQGAAGRAAGSVAEAAQRPGPAHTARQLIAAAAIPAQDLLDNEAVALAQQIGRGEFGFIFRAAQESLQGRLAALETREARLAALVLDRFQLDGDETAAAGHAEALLGALRGPDPEKAVAPIRAALEEDFRERVAQRLDRIDQALDVQYGAKVDPPATDRLLKRDRDIALTVSHPLIDDGDRLMSPAGIEQLIQACSARLPAAADTPSTASVLRMLAALRDDAALRRVLESIGDSGTADARLAPAAVAIVRAGLGLSGEEPVDRAAMRRAALSALLTPLRQGKVGSCFASSMGNMLKESHPAAFLRDAKRMLEDGVLVRIQAGPPEARQSIPITLQTDSSRLEHLYGDSRNPAQHAHLRQALCLGRLVGVEGHIRIEKELQSVRKLLGLDARARAGGVAPSEPTAGAILRQVVATRHGAQGVVGDIDQVRSRMRDLITERSDLKERIIPDSRRLSDKLNVMSPADLAALRSNMEKAQRSYEAARSEPPSANWLAQQGHEAVVILAERRYTSLKRELEALEGAPARLAQAEARLAEIDTLIEQATDDLVRFAEAELTVGDPAAYASELRQAQSLFLAQVDDPLLRAWEYTMASQSELDESVSRANKLEQAASDKIGAFIERQLGAPRADGRPARVPDSFKDALVVAYRQVFKEKLRFVYDASTPTALAQDGQSTAGVWRLHLQDDLADNGTGRAVVGKQDFKLLSGDLIREAGDRIAARYRGRIDARMVAETLASGIYGSDEWVEAVTEGLNASAAADAKPALPWRVDEGGVIESITASAWGTRRELLASDTPFRDLPPGSTNTEGMLDTIIENVTALRAVLTPDQLAEPGQLRLPVRNENHGFVFQPGNGDLRPLLDGSTDAHAFKAALRNGAAAQQRAPLDDRTVSQVLDALRSHFPIGKGKSQLTFDVFERAVRQAPAGGAPMTPQRLVDTFVSLVKRSGFTDVTAYQLADAYIEPEVFASAIAPATGSHAAVADLNWKSGSDPALLAIAWNPFQSRFETGVLYRGSRLWTPNPSLTQNGLTFFVNPSMVLKPPAGIP